MAKHTFVVLSLGGIFLGVLAAFRSSSSGLDSSWLQQLLSSSSLDEALQVATTTAAGLSKSSSQAAVQAYDWLAAHPYPAVIGGLVLYMLVLMAASSRFDKGRTSQNEELKRKFQEYQRFQHYMRLKRWQEQHPEQRQAQQQRQQEEQQNQQSSKWGGMMGFGVQQVPEGCQGPVKEVLSAMDYYEVLGVQWDQVTPKALKAARKAKALSVHPDKIGRDTPGSDLAGSRVNMAFETLSNPKLRDKYDQWLSQQF